jgi:hypothetical protein
MNTNRFTNLKKKIRDRERRFKQMTPERKRVAIAKDVIRSIELDKIITPNSGIYFDNRYFNRIYYYDETSDFEIRDILLENTPECTACAIGSMFLCTVLRDDNLSVKEFNTTHEQNFRGIIRRFFDEAQLDLIECAFERSPRYCTKLSNLDDDVQKAVNFGKKYTKDRNRLIAIMKNIIRNNGTFIPRNRPSYE